VSAAAFSPAGTQLALGGDKRNAHNEVRLVDVRTGVEVKTLLGHKGQINEIAYAPDGRTLVTTSQDRTLRLWELATGQERHRFEGHVAAADSPTFTADGALLAVSSLDAPLYVWDVYGKHGKLSAEKWSAADQDQLWQALGGPDAKAAFQAIRRLVRSPGPAVAMMGTHLKAAQAVDPKRLNQLLSELDSDDFDTRQAAAVALEKLDDAIDGWLKEALASKLSLEGKRRVEALLARFDTPSPQRLARWRSLEALEQIDTTEAQALLQTLAKGAAAARQTREAQESLHRLQKARAASPTLGQ
jgi:hypothetical protein